MSQLAPLDPEALYAAFVARDASYDGRIYAAVTSTGIYCRFSCPARKPLARNTRFLTSPEACRDGGFRACTRCRPDEARHDA